MALNGRSNNSPKRKIPSRKLASRPFSSTQSKSSTTKPKQSRPIQNRPSQSSQSQTTQSTPGNNKPARRGAWSPQPEPPARTIPECFYLMGFDELPTLDELRARYRELAPRMHPDAQGTPEDFKQLTEAYEQAQQHLAERK